MLLLPEMPELLARVIIEILFWLVFRHWLF
jgi:hypothetical protein